MLRTRVCETAPKACYGLRPAAMSLKVYPAGGCVHHQVEGVVVTERRGVPVDPGGPQWRTRPDACCHPRVRGFGPTSPAAPPPWPQRRIGVRTAGARSRPRDRRIQQPDVPCPARSPGDNQGQARPLILACRRMGPVAPRHVSRWTGGTAPCVPSSPAACPRRRREPRAPRRSPASPHARAARQRQGAPWGP